MPRKSYTPEKIIQLLRLIEIAVNQGQSVSLSCREHGIAVQSYYRWRKQYGGMDVSQAKKLKTLEQENARLKKHKY